MPQKETKLGTTCRISDHHFIPVNPMIWVDVAMASDPLDVIDHHDEQREDYVRYVSYDTWLLVSFSFLLYRLSILGNLKCRGILGERGEKGGYV